MERNVAELAPQSFTLGPRAGSWARQVPLGRRDSCREITGRRLGPDFLAARRVALRASGSGSARFTRLFSVPFSLSARRAPRPVTRSILRRARRSCSGRPAAKASRANAVTFRLQPARCGRAPLIQRPRHLPPALRARPAKRSIIIIVRAGGNKLDAGLASVTQVGLGSDRTARRSGGAKPRRGGARAGPPT